MPKKKPSTTFDEAFRRELVQGDGSNAVQGDKEQGMNVT